MNFDLLFDMVQLYTMGECFYAAPPELRIFFRDMCYRHATPNGVKYLLLLNKLKVFKSRRDDMSIGYNVKNKVERRRCGIKVFNICYA